MPHSRSTGRSGATASSAARDVAVGDQPHAPARLADLLDALLVARAVEHDDHHVADVGALALGDQPDRLAERPVEVEQVGDVRAAGHLLHVDARARVEHRALLGERDHGERARAALRAQARALERVDGDVDLAAASRRRPARRCAASAPRPSPPRRSRRRRPCGSCAARRACRRRRPGRRPPCRRGRPSARPAARRPRSRARARARGCGRAAAACVGLHQRTPGGLRGRSVPPARIAPPIAIRITPAIERNQPMPRPISPGRLARAVDDPDVADDAEGGDRHHGGQLPARPRELVVAHDDVGEDQRRDRGGEEAGSAAASGPPTRSPPHGCRRRSRCGCRCWARTTAGRPRRGAGGRRATAISSLRESLDGCMRSRTLQGVRVRSGGARAPCAARRSERG